MEVSIQIGGFLLKKQAIGLTPFGIIIVIILSSKIIEETMITASGLMRI
jgi:hypothetical protein